MIVTCAGYVESEEHMAIDYIALGKRISYFRGIKKLSQETMCDRLKLSREYVSYIENGTRKPSIDTLVDIANVLGVSADDLLVDSLNHSSSTADSELHKLLLDCNDLEENILTRTAKELKSILYSLGI